MKHLLLLTLMCSSSLAFSQKLTKKELYGSYVLKQIDYMYADTTISLNPSQDGFLVLSPLRYAIAYNPGLSKRMPFANLSQPTKEEMIAGFQSFAFNSGSYTIGENELIASPDFAKVPGFEGGQQVYRLDKDDQKLILIMYDETYPSGEKPAWYGQLEIRLSFEKESD